jgi:isopenicillin N synthase-like dioxygenase
MSLVPTLDVAAALASEPGALRHLAAEIGLAARGTGFFRVTGHGLSIKMIEAVFATARGFFALPAAQKDRISIARSKHNRGYVGLRVEGLDPKAGKDHKEAFNIGLDLAPDNPEVLAGKPFRGVNLWPDDPAFRQEMLEYYDFAWALGRFLHRAIALDLALPQEFFESRLDRPMAILRLLRYPPPTGTEHVGAGEHTDYGNLTLLLTDDAGGLEVRTRDGRWLAVPHEPGSFIVNIGDCLMRWTNDVYVSTPHRVTHSKPRERLSIAFFLDPNPDALVECLPTCLAAGETPRYPTISGAEYLMERLKATYA